MVIARRWWRHLQPLLRTDVLARRSAAVELGGEELVELGASVVARREGGEHAGELGGRILVLHGCGEGRDLCMQMRRSRSSEKEKEREARCDAMRC